MPMQQPDTSVFTRLAPTVQAETPADWQQQAARAQAAQALAQEQRAKAQQAAEARADEALIRQIGQETGGDPEQMITRLRVVNPRVALKFDEEWGKVQKQNIDRGTAEVKLEREQLDTHLGLLKMAEGRPDLYPAIRARIVKGDPEMEPYLPADYDPAKIAPVFQMGQTAKGILDADEKSFEHLLKGDYMAAVGWALSDPTADEQEYNAAKAALIQNRVPRAVVDRFPPWSPDAWRVALDMARTPEQRADAAARATEQAATREHQRVTEEQGERRTAATEARVDIAERTAQRLAAGGGGGNEPVVAVMGDDGTPIYVPRSQAAGRRPAGGAGGAAGTVKLPAAVSTQIAGVEQSLSVLDKMAGALPTSMMGPIAGRWTKFSAGAPGVPVPAPVAKYLAEEATLRNAVIKATTGAAMSEPEAQRIMEQIPSITDKPEVWQAKAQATRENLGLLRQRLLELSGVSGDRPPLASPTAPSGTKRRDIKGGGVAELRNGKWIRVE